MPNTNVILFCETYENSISVLKNQQIFLQGKDIRAFVPLTFLWPVRKIKYKQIKHHQNEDKFISF